MRKIACSRKVPSKTRLSSRAEPTSEPKGFSTMTLALLAQPAFPSCSTAVSNSGGGIAR